MAKITLLVGLLLVVLGLVAYLALATGEQRSITALIPAFFGLPITVLGALAVKAPPRRRMVFMHIAVVLAVLGAIGTVRGALGIPALFSDPDSLARPSATAVQAIMFVICAVYVGMAVASFVKARRGGP